MPISSVLAVGLDGRGARPARFWREGEIGLVHRQHVFTPRISRNGCPPPPHPAPCWWRIAGWGSRRVAVRPGGGGSGTTGRCADPRRLRALGARSRAPASGGLCRRPLGRGRAPAGPDFAIIPAAAPSIFTAPTGWWSSRPGCGLCWPCPRSRAIWRMGARGSSAAESGAADADPVPGDHPRADGPYRRRHGRRPPPVPALASAEPGSLSRPSDRPMRKRPGHPRSGRGRCPAARGPVTQFSDRRAGQRPPSSKVRRASWHPAATSRDAGAGRRHAAGNLDALSRRGALCPPPGRASAQPRLALRGT